MKKEMCNKAVDNFLPALKFVFDWFVTSKIIKKNFISYFMQMMGYFFYEESCNVTFMQWVFLV